MPSYVSNFRCVMPRYNRLGQCEEVKCPFDSAHQVRSDRLQFHITKCQMVHNHSMTFCCDYNSVHVFQTKKEQEEHMSCCPDRVKLEKFHLEQSCERLYPVQQFNIKSDENWDDVEVPTYDPNAYCKNNLILELHQVVPPSIKREFDKEQRKKFLTLQQEKLHEKTVKSTIRRPNSISKTQIMKSILNEKVAYVYQ